MWVLEIKRLLVCVCVCDRLTCSTEYGQLDVLLLIMTSLCTIHTVYVLYEWARIAGC